MSSVTDRLRTALAGRYTIERELGQGGMATVYLAHDVKHDRQVALKALRPDLAAVIGAERFLAEIKTTAHLQHPHILALFDSGEADGLVFYVMPFVKGESLRARIVREHQLPVGESVQIALEVADALEYAHSHGIVHRDIKPENILLHGGHALVVDFGIALAASRSDGGTRMTETGMSLGTPHYMSPEQAMGEREITPKADVYALGCVLYEMLTGEPPFTGATAQAVIARVMTETPRALAIQRRTIPANVEAAVLTALEKLPADRFASARQFASALRDESYRSTAAIAPPPAAEALRVPGRLTLLHVMLAALAGLAIGGAVMALLRPSPSSSPLRYGLGLPPAQAPDPDWRAIPSPDGSRIVYVGPAERGTQLWVKQRDRYEATALAGTAGANHFTFSPDGEWIAFAVQEQIKKISMLGGPAIVLADGVRGASGVAWLDDDGIVFSFGSELMRTSAEGGQTTVLLSDSAFIALPNPLPGAKAVLYSRIGAGRPGLYALDFESGSVHHVIPDAVMGQYLPPRHIIYVQGNGGVFAIPFDAGSLKTRGSPVPVMDGVSVRNDFYPFWALSRSGTLVMRLGETLTGLRYEMVWVAQDGRETPVDPDWAFLLTRFGANIGWALSPDDTRLAIGLNTDAGDDIWMKPLPRGPLSRVSFDAAAEYRPRWMPDGRSVMFASNRVGEGAGGLYRRAADGTGSDSLLLRATAGVFEGLWSPDGEWLLFRTGGDVSQVGGRDVHGMRPGVDTTKVPVIVTPYDEEAVAFSPDGRWLAYESNETGRTEVFIRTFPDTDAGKWQVSSGGGVAPLWARDGRTLYYVNADREMMAVSVASGAAPQLGERRMLFKMREELYLAAREYYTPFDIAADGRFIMARSVTPPSSIQTPLVVVENWLEELREKIK